MMMKNRIITLACVAATLALCACRVETKTEPIPEAEGSGKKAITLRMEPMSREEIKSATDSAIDKTAEAATKFREAATTAVENLQTVGKNVTTFTDTMINMNKKPEQSATVTTTTQVTTDTNP